MDTIRNCPAREVGMRTGANENPFEAEDQELPPESASVTPDTVDGIESTGRLLHILFNSNLLTNRATVDLLHTLLDYNLLTEAIISTIAARANPESLAKAVDTLRSGSLLTQDNFSAVAAHAAPEHLASALWSP